MSIHPDHINRRDMQRLRLGYTLLCFALVELALHYILATADSNRFVSCYVSSQDSTLLFINPQMNAVETTYGRCGRTDTVTTANAGLRFVPSTDRARFIRLLRFLNRNLISSIWYDMSIGFWLYGYGVTRQDDYYEQHRDLLIYDTPADTLRPAVRYVLKPHDKKQRMVLVSHNRPANNL